jgi:hypothetical protein
LNNKKDIEEISENSSENPTFLKSELKNLFNQKTVCRQVLF